MTFHNDQHMLLKFQDCHIQFELGMYCYFLNVELNLTEDPYHMIYLNTWKTIVSSSLCEF
jgi:hypothetical protein